MNKMKALRLMREWSQRKLAKESGLNITTVGAIERAMLTPYPVHLKKLAAALGLRPGQESSLLEEFQFEENVGDISPNTDPDYDPSERELELMNDAPSAGEQEAEYERLRRMRHGG